jgi:AmmeMemoRadiSam system protein B/AmmeMemoRadiSam system protein A
MSRLFTNFNLSGILILIFLILESSCHSQTREAAVAGQFYPGSSSELKKDLQNLFASKKDIQAEGKVLAVIAPHAGYVFSGPVAAESFEQIDRDIQFDNIFLIGSSHRFSFEGASIYTLGNFETPLGEVQVNLDLAKELCRKFSVFTTRTDAQMNEHSLEVQLPFLQYWLHKPFRIIPIILGTQNVSTCHKIAEALRPYFNQSNLFVISTDFSHYPAYTDAQNADHKTAEAILANKPDRLMKAIQINQDSDIPGLATSLCGWTSVMTLLFITEEIPGIAYKLIDYRNSGDAAVGDKSRVVGYCAIGVYSTASSSGQTKNSSYQIPDGDRTALLKLARETIASFVSTGKIPVVETEKLSPVLKTPAGAFVSLYKNKQLRGCIGRFDPDQPLYKVVQDMAVASSTRDTRFSPVESSELGTIRIEISVLTPLKRINSPDEIILGKHGIYMKKGYNSGTFLPQVANSTGWTKEEFLGHCSRDKAGMGWEGWKTAELYTYEAIVFGE